jgi:hypothetical protein
VPRLVPSGKGIRDDFYGRRCDLSEFNIASSLSLNSLPLGFEKISCFVQLPDKLFDLRNRWSTKVLNKWPDIRDSFALGRRRRLQVSEIAVVASEFHNHRSLPLHNLSVFRALTRRLGNDGPGLATTHPPLPERHGRDDPKQKMRAFNNEVTLTALWIEISLLDAHGELTVDEGRRCSTGGG